MDRKRKRSRMQGSPDGRGVGFHKVGIGKPLGLGLVEARIVNNALYLEKTQDITSGYETLTSVLGTHYKKVDVSTLLQKSKIGDLSKLPWVRAFQRVAYGFDSTEEKNTEDVPVRYVSLEENKHNTATTKDGRPKRFYEQEWIAGRSPQPLWITDLATVPDVYLAETQSEEYDNSSETSKKDLQSSHKSKHEQS